MRKRLLFTMCFLIMFLDERIEETPIIYYVLSHRVSRRAHWGNPYYLMGASSFCFPAGALSLGKPLLFTMCFPILFPGERIGETSIIYYVLPHHVPRRAHCHWGNLYYLLCASPSCSSASALPLGKPLLFSGCFPTLIPGKRIGETSII